MSEEKLYVIYKFTSPSNKSYIGMTKNIKIRIRIHLQDSKKEKYKHYRFYKAINKYGFNNFKFEILAQNLLFEQATKMEIMFIKWFNTKTPYGYNLTEGGEGTVGYTCSDNERFRRSEHAKNYKHSAESKQKISKSNMGKIMSKTAREKISKANKGKTRSLECRLAMKISHKGVSGIKKGTKFNLNAAQRECYRKRIAKINTNKQLRYKITNLVSYPIKCIETGTIFDSIKMAAERTGISLCSLRYHLYRGSASPIYGLYTFIYLNKKRQEQTNKFYKAQKPNNKKTVIKCIETGRIYNSLQETANLTKIPKGTLADHLKLKTKAPIYNMYSFVYLEKGA